MTADRRSALLEQLVALRQEAQASPERRQRLLAWADRIAVELRRQEAHIPTRTPAGRTAL
jgi:hypothetical protein